MHEILQMVSMLQLLCFKKDMGHINQGVSILLIVMVVIFELSGILSLNGWNTVQVLIKHFTFLVVCLAPKVVIKKLLYLMAFNTGKVLQRNFVFISLLLRIKILFLLGKLVNRCKTTRKEM